MIKLTVLWFRVTLNVLVFAQNNRIKYLENDSRVLMMPGKKLTHIPPYFGCRFNCSWIHRKMTHSTKAQLNGARLLMWPERTKGFAWRNSIAPNLTQNQTKDTIIIQNKQPHVLLGRSNRITKTTTITIQTITSRKDFQHFPITSNTFAHWFTFTFTFTVVWHSYKYSNISPKQKR